jgi:hypothetical protein
MFAFVFSLIEFLSPLAPRASFAFKAKLCPPTSPRLGWEHISLNAVLRMAVRTAQTGVSALRNLRSVGPRLPLSVRFRTDSAMTPNLSALISFQSGEAVIQFHDP